MIAYDPPVAAIPNDWKYYFIEEERSQLPEEEQERYIEQALELLYVVFLKNSEEKE